MADTLVTSVIGQAGAAAVPVEVQLMMTDRALLAGDDTPAQLTGYGTVPAAWARDLLTARGTSRAVDGAGPVAGAGDGAGAEAMVWLRRLYTHPATGALVAMDSTRRPFDGGLRRFILTRDAGTCRTPCCDAPARHVDHVRDHADGGPTNESNGQGLCVRCNLTKQHPGFRAVTLTAPTDRGDPTQQPGAPHTVVTTTPTGHAYASHAPPLVPGLLHDQDEPPDQHEHDPDVTAPHLRGRPADELSPLERALALALAA
ncbi:HNH endonuclease [Terrabacter terrigena]|uniref:HNH endonuclease n=1 Tax=Terrabacter terrigena TaxID=574718 RepID=A0ABW3MS29_9MICO